MSLAIQKFSLTHEHLTSTEVLLHCTVVRWSLSTAKELDSEVSRLFFRLQQLGYETGITFSPNPQFCEYMGGEQVGSITWKGIDYGVYTWDLKQPRS